MMLHRNPEYPWKMTDVAKRVGLSQSQLERLFQAQLKISPVAYLRRQRVDAMAELLTATTLTIAEAAQRVGLANPATASRAFTRRYGLPPSTYRREVLPLYPEPPHP